VTERVRAAVKPEMSPDDANKARGNAIAQIEKESREKTGLRADVVTLYQGGQFHLYRYKRYDDVRLVFAPEEQIAFYGGDPDNFEYPRYDLDICIFRAYENGKPAKIEHYLKWNTKGPADGELTFVSGDPGRTDRALAVSELAELRDQEVPYLLNMFYRRETYLHAWGARSFENKRRAEQQTRSVENNRKRYDGYLAGLLDPDVWRAIEERQKKITDATTGALFDKIKQAQVATAKVLPIYNYFERFRGQPEARYQAPRAFNSTLFQYARRLLRHGDEITKPNGERFPEFRDSYKESLELELFGDHPVYDDFEIVKLTDSLTDMTERFGADDPLVKQVLAGKSPVDRATELVTGTKLKDVTFRKQLYADDAAAVSAAKDPMIELARMIDGPARDARKVYEAQDETKHQAYAEIAKARFAAQGTSTYPDATFTLRLSYGTVRGYEERGKQIPAITNTAGLYQRGTEHNNQPPFDIPKRWLDRKSKLNPNTPFNFVNDADIIGGNSGSPVVNKNNEFVGIIFDGNIQSLVLDCIYTDKQARAVSVDSAAISEALEKVYDAKPLLDELMGAK
jgi:hypothetical protein